jgi:hypothetical protein
MEMPKEGYLLVYGESGDEVHVDLITKEFYNAIVEIIGDWEAVMELTFDDNNFKPVFSWFTQTFCIEKWPYNNVRILGTVSIART